MEAATEQEAALFKVLSEPTRLTLAVLLALRGETCVCMLAEALEAPESKISRHLGVMRAAGVVEARREGTWMHYKLVEPRSDLERRLQECLRDSLGKLHTLKDTRERLTNAICRSELSPAERRTARAAARAAAKHGRPVHPR